MSGTSPGGSELCAGTHAAAEPRSPAVADAVSRREAIRRVAVVLGGAAFVGGDALVAACSRERAAAATDAPVGEFTREDIAFLDEVAETILPQTSTPGAKAAHTGAFVALMVTDTYDARDQQVFRDGMRKLDRASLDVHGVPFLNATAEQRLTLIQQLDREQKRHMDAREAAKRRAEKAANAEQTPEAYLPDQRQEAAPAPDASAAPAITADAPAHYFRMMKELTLLGYFTSEIGCTQAQRYVESPGRFDPCVPYREGERTWAPHA